MQNTCPSVSTHSHTYTQETHCSCLKARPLARVAKRREETITLENMISMEKVVKCKKEKATGPEA